MSTAGPQAPPSAFGAQVPQQSMQQAHLPPPTSLSAGGDPQDPQNSSPFAQAQSPSAHHLMRSSLGLGTAPMDMSSAGLSNLAAIFSGPFSSAELNKFQSVSGLNFSNFPSLPQVSSTCHPLFLPG